MTNFSINKSINNFNDIEKLKLKLDEIHIQYKTDKYGLVINACDDELLSVMELFIGKAIVFSVIE